MPETLIGVQALPKDLLVDIYDDGERKIQMGGKTFYLLGDTEFGKGSRSHQTYNQKHPGLRPRWAKVLSTNEEAEIAGIEVGDKVLLDTLCWSRGVVYDQVQRKKVWRIPVKDVLLVDDAGLTKDEIEHIKRHGRSDGHDD